ncbi:fungal-specific transcription factor domain-containing protein [Cercophora newfieldiana]|uniref:Fungal-specific transcription factor domain-containing protein n=1 Tax=Cercophora newfieldiana TaxID=92897 RepID=A0AA39YSI0_9PEZI|nr:fungal-specific transcription factor domain-containing protein [Cercophora newfieldiana]
MASMTANDGFPSIAHKFPHPSADAVADAVHPDFHCKMGDMFWNWRTVDACFISSGWRIQSASMFAGTCIIVILFTITHQGFRFLGKFYDRWAMERFGDGECYRPTVLMQLVRAGIHTLQVVTAYFLMILAMYLNGWYIICIFIGSFIGFFVFHWDSDPADTKEQEGSESFGSHCHGGKSAKTDDVKFLILAVFDVGFDDLSFEILSLTLYRHNCVGYKYNRLVSESNDDHYGEQDEKLGGLLDVPPQKEEMRREEKPEWMDNGPLQKEKADWLKQDVKLKASRRRERRYLHALEHGIETLDVSNAHDSDSGDASFLQPSPPAKPGNTNAVFDTQKAWPQQPQSSATLPTPPGSTPGEPGECNAEFHESGWGIVERELNTTMMYLDYVFPFLYPFYRPSLLAAGRGWLLVLFARNKALLHTALSLASTFFNAILSQTSESQSEPCRSHNWTELTRQQEIALQELQAEMQRIVARGVKDYLVETTRVMASVIQLLTFEVSIANTGNWVMHLDAATELFSLIVQEHAAAPDVNSAFFVNLLMQLGPGPFGAATRNQPWSADQASLRFSVAFLIFFDTIAATSLERPPRLLSFHRHLLAGPGEETKESLVPDGKGQMLPSIDLCEFIGVENWIVIAIGEIAALDCWKKEMKRNGSLSVSQLVLRATAIEQNLQRNIATLGQCNTHGRGRPGSASALLDVVSQPGLNPRQLNEIIAWTSAIWAQGALTYLNVVVSGWQPSCPEFRNSVALTIEMLKTLPAPSCMRSVMWPFAITGCMANPDEEQTFRDLVAAMGPLQLFGTATKTLAIMEHVWAHRAEIEGSADQWDYAACLKSVGHASLLL